jgi:hypothetical protein
MSQEEQDLKILVDGLAASLAPYRKTLGLSRGDDFLFQIKLVKSSGISISIEKKVIDAPRPYRPHVVVSWDLAQENWSELTILFSSPAFKKYPYAELIKEFRATNNTPSPVMLRYSSNFLKVLNSILANRSLPYRIRLARGVSKQGPIEQKLFQFCIIDVPDE